MKNGSRTALIVIFAAGAVFRLFFWGNGLLHLPVGSDEAILGLMAREVFSGEFPLMIWVQPHGGALETYLTAPLYLLFGGGKLTVRLFPFVYSILFMVLIYLIGRDFFGRRAGLMSAALAAVPPVYVSMLGALGISMNLPAFIGSAFIIYMAHRCVKIPMNENRRLVLMMLAGLAAGLTFWVHLIVACAVAAVILFLFMDDKFFFARKPFWGFALCFVLGAFPLLIFNFQTDFSTFRMSPARDIAGTLAYIRTCLTYTLPRAWGLQIPVYIDNAYFLPVNRLFGGLYGITALALAGFAAAKRLKGSRFFFRRGSAHPDGAWLLIFLSAVCIVVFARSSRSNAHSIRYIIYTFIGFLPLIGSALSEIFRKNRPAAVGLAGFLVIFHLAAGIMLMRAWASPEFVEEKLNIPDNSGLISYLEDEGITRGYMHYWLSYPVVFRTDGGVIMSPAFDERFGRYRHPYLDEVESAEEVSYIFHPAAGLRAGWFRDNIQKAGGGFKEESVDNFTVFYGFRPPFEGELAAADGAGIKIASSHNSEELAFLLDSDEATRWASRAPQTPGMFLRVELPEAEIIAGIRMGFGRWGHDYPRGIEILVSEDGEEWSGVCSVPDLGGSVYWDSLGNPRIFVSGDSYSFLFEPVPAGAVKIVQTGSHHIFDWSVTGLEIFTPAGGGSSNSGE